MLTKPSCCMRVTTWFSLGLRGMPESLEISDGAKSGDRTLRNAGVKLDGTFKCPHSRQTFTDDKALQLHLKYQSSTAIAKQINPVGDWVQANGL